MRARWAVAGGALGAVGLAAWLWFAAPGSNPSVGSQPVAPAAHPAGAEDPSPSPAAVAVVVATSGPVDWLGAAGERRSIGVGAELGEGAVMTGPGATVRVRLSDGRELELAADGRMRLAPAPGGLVVHIERGRVLARTPKGAGSSLALEIATPFGVTRIGPAGSEADLRVEGDRVRIEVAVGRVAFIDARGKRVDLAANQSIEVSVGGVRLLAGGRPSRSTGEAGGPMAKPNVRVADPVAPPMDLHAEIGKLRVRETRAPWRSERQARVQVGTAFEVAARGRARLAGPGIRGRLASRARGHFRGDDPGGAAGSPALALDRGSLWAVLDPGAVLPLAPPAGGRIHLVAGSTTSVRLAGSRSRPTVSVLLGQLEVRRGAETLPVAAGQSVVLGPGRLAAAPTARPEIALPAIKRLGVHSDGIELADLAWGPTHWPPGRVSAEVEVALDPDFRDVLLAGTGTRPHLQVPIPPGRAALFWRIRSAGGRPAQSGSVRFAPDRGRSVLDLSGPKNLVFESRTMTTVHFQGALPALTFSFDEKPGAARYRLQVFAAGDPGKPLVDRVVAEPLCALRAGDLPEGPYLWHAVATDAKGRTLGAGRPSRLEIVYDNALSTLAIKSPKPNQRVRGARVPVSGVAPVKSRLFVNGQPVPLDDKGRFDLELARSQAFVFRLVEGRDQERFWIRRLRGPS